MTRAVLDTMIYLQALGSPNGAAGAILARALTGAFVLVLSADTVAEVRDVLHRPKVRKNYPHVTDEDVARFLSAIDAVAECVHTVSSVFTYPRDPKDEKYLNLAVAANASVIVSRDNDLLDLMNPTNLDGVAFRTAHPTISILEPAAFLQTLPTA
jgi:putative PIN family toxin of toxin-antitoxin system